MTAYSMALGVKECRALSPEARFEIGIGQQAKVTLGQGPLTSEHNAAEVEVTWDFATQGALKIFAVAERPAMQTCVMGLTKWWETGKRQVDTISLGEVLYDGSQKTLDFVDLVLNVTLTQSKAPSAPPLGALRSHWEPLGSS